MFLQQLLNSGKFYKLITLILNLGFCCPGAICQNDTVSSSKNFVTPTAVASETVKKTEIFNSGFLDFQNSGQMNASARIFKINVGEPNKFFVPISIYSGVSGNNINNYSVNKGSEQMVLGIINPMSGIFNVFTENTIKLKKKTTQPLTNISLVYQLGEKVISGNQAITFKNIFFFTTYLNSGLLFKTGAWIKDKEKNMGTFWALLRIHLMKINKPFALISGYPPNDVLFKGYSIGMGIDINNVLNIKAYYYRYLNPSALSFDLPIYQLTFNYNLKN